MEKESENTLDLVLDIQNLNPFDRPPNIMDDDLNSVTQEELEANLSTDCPQSNMESTTPTSLEQLIQSVFEDTSTQDAVEQHEDDSVTNNQNPSVTQESEELQVFLKEEMQSEKESEDVVSSEWQQDVEALSLEENVNIKLEGVNLQHTSPNVISSPMEVVEKSSEHSTENELDTKLEDISVHSELMVTQTVDDCYYVDTNIQGDIDDDICQVEVYASNKDIAVGGTCGDGEIKEEMSDDNYDDDISNVSSISIGHLEEDSSGGNKNTESDSVSKLSVIISDHCYSQEQVSTKEIDALKQNLLNYIIQRIPTRDYHDKLCTLVDTLFDGIENDKMDILLNALEVKPEPATTKPIHNDEFGKVNQEEEIGLLEKEDTEQEPTNNEQIKQENAQDIDLIDGYDEHKLKLSEDKDDSESTCTEKPDTCVKELASADASQSIANTDIPEEKELDISKAIAQSSTPLEDDAMESVTGTDNDRQAISQAIATIQQSNVSKTVTESLPDNCSEPLEHYIFEEEFELLCKNGNRKLDKFKPEFSSELLNTLTEFATNMQADCQSFSSASTNIELKLHLYIRQQYEHFQETFKAYCYDTKATDTKSVETQTDFKKLTKCHRREINMESKKNLLKTSDKSSLSSLSSSSEEDVHFNKMQKRRRNKRSTKNKMESSDLEASGSGKEKSNINIIGTSAPLTLAQLDSNIITNHSHEYDDGINLSQYVQSEIFDIESASQQSPLPSSVDDSDVSAKEDNEDGTIQNNYLNEDGDSDSTILYKPKKRPATNNDTSSAVSHSATKMSCKSRNDDVSVNSESDKENVSSRRKDKKSHDSMDEDEKNDKEIERLINIDGLSKRVTTNGTSTKCSEKSKSKVPASKNLNDRFDFMDVEFGSDDEVKSEAEEEIITEKQFLERHNEDIKRQMLEDSSSDSEQLDEEDDELLKGASEEDDESGKNSPLVDKFLKTYVVDNSDNDNDVGDEDDDIDSDSDKDVTASVNKETSNKEEEPGELDSKESEEVKDDSIKADSNSNIDADGESPSALDVELLNDHLLFRKRGSRPQKLDKMLSDAEKRKKISKIDEELICLSSDTENSDVEAIDEEASQTSKPRAIKPMLRPDQLAGETIKAQKRENERISRLERKHNMLEKILKDYPDVDKNKELILDYIKDTKTFIKVHPGIVKYLKPHQYDGVRFMYDSCYGGVDSLKKSPGSGCILAHCMGLGKTLQLIALLHTVISFKELKTTKILVLCPKSTVMNWADEIVRWLGPLREKNLKVYTFNDTSDIYEKLNILREWSRSNHARAGCLLIGYEAFRTLVFYHSYKNRGNVNPHRLEEIRKNVNSYLLEPGADLVICDEGHIIKNSKSAISMAVAQIVTPRRIVLTGTPIQNNLKEYYSMVNFIKPLFLGTEKEFANLYANPIKNGQHKDSGKADIKVMKQRSFVLHKKLSKFVQRKEAELLKTFLPQKFEYVLFIPMTEVQNNLYQYILNTIKNRDDTYRGKGLITDYTCLRKIWTHPKVLEDAWKNAVCQRNKKELRQKQKDHNSDDDQPDDIYDSQTGQMSVTNDWWRSLVTERDLESVMPSNKLRTMFKILQMCEEKGEKCLIFSAFVAVLNVVEYFFKKITENDPMVRSELSINTHSQWILGKDYYRLDGKTPKSMRHAMINEFNSDLNKRSRVFLISAKAGGQGINLIGANRVIILDTSWNPSNDQQNIFRVFRLGQKRNCYIYRLLAMGTMEEKVYSRSVTKQAMSFRVVDEQQIDRHYNMAELAELYILTIPDHNNRPTPLVPQDSVLARLLRSFPDLVYKYHEHDSLLENKVEQELSEQEKNEAWTAYERDLQMSSEIREVPNMEDLQNKFNASNLANYMSPFSGLDVSNTANTNNSNNSKNMSHFFGNRGFTQPLLQSLLGANSNAATTQQYIDMFNYYKNLGTYSDLNSYSTLPGISAGRALGGPPTSAAPNPLAALGDLSMYGLASPGLQSLGPPSASTMNLANSMLAGALPPMPTPPASAPMYTSSTPSMAGSTVTAGLSSAGLTNTTSSSSLSAFQQYAQTLRNTFPNIYNFAGDFGIGSSGSTILDKSKSGKNMKHSSGGSSNKNMTNLPGGSKSGGNANPTSIYPGSSVYLTQHQQQSRPSSRNTPTESGNKAKTASSSSNSMPTSSSSNSMTTSPPNPMTINQNAARSSTNDVPSSLINYRRSESSSSSNSTPPNQSQISNKKRGNSDIPNGNGPNNASGTVNNGQSSKQISKHLNSDTSIQAPTTIEQSLKSSAGITGIRSTKSSNADHNRPINVSSVPTISSNIENSRPMNMATISGKSSNVDGNRPMNMTTVSTKSSNVDNNRPANIIDTRPSSKPSNMDNSRNNSGSNKSSGAADNNRSTHMNTGSTTKSSNVDNSRSGNMGILYPNSKGNEKSANSKSNSPLNMGIVYPRSSGKSSSSEMQIIPTSSPPGTTSISKHLNDLSPSISLTAVKNTGQTKSLSVNPKLSTPPQTLQINKVIQNNATMRRTTSPVTTSGVNNSKVTPTNVNNSSTTGTNQGSILARLKAANNKKATSLGNSNVNPPPLHRANTTLGTSSSGSTINITAKSGSGLTITNVKTPIKSQNAANKPQLNTSVNQASTLAKQQAAASVAKSNIQRTSTPTSNIITPTSNPSNLQKSPSTSLPSLTSIKRTIIKRTSPNTSAPNKIPSISSSSSVTVTSSNKLPIISSVKSISPSISTINKTPLSKTSQSSTLQNKQLPSISNVSRTIAQKPKRLSSSMTVSAASTSSSATAASSAGSLRNTVNIRPVDNKQNSSGMGGGVYIIETNINDKKVAIGAPTKSGGGTTVTKVPLQNPNKRKAADPLSKDISLDSKRLKN